MGFEPSFIDYSEQQRTQAKQKLQELQALCTGMTGAMITTMHADVIVHTLGDTIHPQKLSTMTGSLLDLGEVIAEETAQKQCQFTIVENTDGRVVSLQIDHNLMLTCIANLKGNLGLVLSYGRKTADDLADIMKV